MLNIFTNFKKSNTLIVSEDDLKKIQYCIIPEHTQENLDILHLCTFKTPT